MFTEHKVMRMTSNQLDKISETLEDFKALLSRYRKIKNDESKSKSFFVRNRNPIWDITNAVFFKTGLASDSVKRSSSDTHVDDHFIQRSRAMKFIFNEIDKNENMTVEQFVPCLKKYCSTVKLTKEEHQKVTSFAKNNSSFLNYEIYLKCGIEVKGLSELILN